jgi:hypothetical protein
VDDLKLQVVAYERALSALTPWLDRGALQEAVDILSLEHSMARTASGRAAVSAALKILKDAANAKASVADVWARRGWDS